jgi:hypothetical protein
MLNQSNAARSPSNLVLERLPNGEFAWLRESSDTVDADDAPSVVTVEGSRALVDTNLFGPWPTDVEASLA